MQGTLDDLCHRTPDSDSEGEQVRGGQELDEVARCDADPSKKVGRKNDAIDQESGMMCFIVSFEATWI